MGKDEIKKTLFQEYVKQRKDMEWYRLKKDDQKMDASLKKSYLIVEICAKLTGENEDDLLDEFFDKWCEIIKDDPL